MVLESPMILVNKMDGYDNLVSQVITLCILLTISGLQYISKKFEIQYTKFQIYVGNSYCC